MGTCKPLVLLSGPDGSGKTTLALYLKKKFEKEGYKVVIVRLRGTHTFAFLLTLFMKNILRLRGVNLHYYNTYIPRKLNKTWVEIELLSIIPLVILYYYFYRLKFLVISERSIIDVLTWIMGGLQHDGHLVITRLLAFRVFIYLISKFKPILITADIKDLISRKPGEVKLIRTTMIYYTVIAKSLGIILLNTSLCNMRECGEALYMLVKNSNGQGTMT